MKKSILFFCLLFLSMLSYAQAMVQFKISKPYCVLNFLEAATNQPASSPTLKEYIDLNTKNDIDFQPLCAEFASIQLHYNYKRDEFPENRRPYRSTKDLIYIALVNSNTIEEFKRKTIGILPNSEHQKLITVLKKAEKYYDKIIWDSYNQKLENQRKELEKYTTTVEEFFKIFKYFYNSSWGDDTPFVVTLYPIPGERGISMATPHANSLCIGVLTDEENYEDKIGVVLHEMCHVLYDEQPNDFQHKIDNWFNNSKSLYKQHAYNYFDEALATALGNGWAYKQLSGTLYSGDWYNNEYINKFAKAIYPMVEGYMTTHMQIDSLFINEAIKFFGENFPNSVTEYNILLSKAVVYVDAENAGQRKEKLNMITSEFQLTNAIIVTPIVDAENMEMLKSNSSTQLIIIDKNHQENWDALKTIFPQLSKISLQALGTAKLLSFYDNVNKPVIIIYAKDKEQVLKLVKKMKDKKYFDRNKIIQE